MTLAIGFNYSLQYRFCCWAYLFSNKLSHSFNVSDLIHTGNFRLEIESIHTILSPFLTPETGI
jgi:hypothetical protein